MSARLPDYYAILHVDPSAPAEVIRASYRTLMQQLGAHPDLGGDHEAAAQLNAAWATLKDPVRRAQYDAQRAAAPVSGKRTRPRQEAKPRQTAARSSSAAPAARPQARASASQSGTYDSTGVWLSESQAAACVDICPFCGVAAMRGKHGADPGEECRVCEAPLTIARPVGRNDAETQRSVYRIAKAEVVRVYVDPQDLSGFDAAVHDVSLSGIRISCAFQFSAESLIRIDSDFCAAVARIAHVSVANSGATQYGAEFLTVRFKRQRGSLLSVPA